MKNLKMRSTSLLLFLTLFSWFSGFAQANQVVFVCEHGSAKSVIAAVYFNKIASERNIPWRAVARGTNPDTEISPKTKALLTEEGLLDNSMVPQQLSQRDVDTASKVILFTALPGDIQGKNKATYWSDVQAVNEDFRRLKNDIVSRLTPMLDSLAKQ